MAQDMIHCDLQT